MNQAQIHLALTHMPVILSMTGLVILIISLIMKNTVVIKTSFYIFLIAGLFTIPVYFTGEGAEEMVEHLPGVSESIIEKHEQIAGFSLWVIMATALVSLVGLIKLSKKSLFQFVKIPVLLLALVASGLMTYTAHLGEQVRHPEVLSSLSPGNLEADVGENDNEHGAGERNKESLVKEDEKEED